jgi:predicted Ser/Thr protein kinase
MRISIFVSSASLPQGIIIPGGIVVEDAVEARDVILGNVLVERGWLSPEELSRCLREAEDLIPQRPLVDAESPLSRVVLSRELLPKDELAVLGAELTKVLEWGPDFKTDQEVDLRLGHQLRSAEQLSPEYMREARALQAAAASSGLVPRLAEILLAKGFASLSSIQDALHALQQPGTPMSCGACKAACEIVGYDATQVYLCRSCRGELLTMAEAARLSSPGTPAVSGEPAGEFGRYTLPVEIGRGGMGVVYKAWDEAHRRWVALKKIPDTGRLEDLARFRREVEIARTLHHPNIVALYEVTHLGSNHLLTMEYVDGATLAGRRLSPARAAGLIATIARTVQFAHSRGIVHRDIKPQNVMIDRTGKPYLMDFGLATAREFPSSVTSVGTVMGTPGYMAPEQAIGRSSRIDRRTDVYGLGAILYQLLTGRPPFQGATPLDTIRKVVDEDLTPPSRFNPDIPRALEGVVLKSLDKDKVRRHPTARHLAEDLERFVENSAVGSSQTAPA